MPISASKSALTIVCVLWGGLLVGGCRPPQRETAEELQPAARSWAQTNGLPLASDRALEAVVGDSTVVALGEAAHGSLDVFEARASMTKRLIEAGWAKAIVLENDAWHTCRVDAYVQGKTSDPSALPYSLIGLYQHDAAREFFAWLRVFNRNAEEPVAVYGMDVQTDAACRTEIAGCGHREELCAQAETLQGSRALGSTSWLRDEFMATNVVRVANEVGAGVVVWVHSGHAMKSAPMLAWDTRKGAAPMGQHLVGELGRRYRAVNVTFATGGVSAGNTGGRLFRFRPRRSAPMEEFQLAEPPPVTVEGTLVAPEPTVYSLGELAPGSEASAWFARPHFSRSIGSTLGGWRAKKGSAYNGWAKIVPRESFDSVVVLPDSRAIDFD